MSIQFTKFRSGLSTPGLASPPSDPFDGDIYFNNVSQQWMQYTNGAWSVLGSESGDISPTSFSAANNQVSPADVTGLLFSDSSTSAATAFITVNVQATSSLYEYFTLNVVQNASGWYISQTSVGDDSGFTFSITTAGQIQYTDSNYTGFTSATLLFRGVSL